MGGCAVVNLTFDQQRFVQGADFWSLPSLFAFPFGLRDYGSACAKMFEARVRAVENVAISRAMMEEGGAEFRSELCPRCASWELGVIREAWESAPGRLPVPWLIRQCGQCAYLVMEQITVEQVQAMARDELDRLGF